VVGEIVALLGRNGAEVHAAEDCRARTAGSGRIEYDGRDIAGMAAPGYRAARIGYVPQGRGLFRRQNVADNLALGRLARRPTAAPARSGARSRFSTIPALKEAATSRPTTLRRRAADARGRAPLSGNVRLLLLDEPVRGLRPPWCGS